MFYVLFWPPRTEKQNGGDETVDQEERRGPQSETDSCAVAVFSASHFVIKQTRMKGRIRGRVESLTIGREEWTCERGQRAQ